MSLEKGLSIIARSPEFTGSKSFEKKRNNFGLGAFSARKLRPLRPFQFDNDMRQEPPHFHFTVRKSFCVYAFNVKATLVARRDPFHCMNKIRPENKHAEVNLLKKQ